MDPGEWLRLNSPFLLIGASFALALGIVAWAAYAASRRRRAFQELAARLGFTFSPQGDEALARSLPHPLFKRGRGGALHNLIEGSLGGARTRLFEYAFVTGHGKSRTVRTQTVAAFLVEGGDLPEFELFPERFYHALAEAVGYKDIDFDEVPDFSSAYRLLGKDEARVRSLFHGGLLQALAERPGWTAEGAGRTLLLYRSERVAGPEELPAFLEEARQLAARFRT